jgi:ribosomal protein S18 acetylase RimI-like enzyme
MSPSVRLSRENIRGLYASWDILEFYDHHQGKIVGVVGREPSNYLHILVQARHPTSWNPRVTLEEALDILLSDADPLFAGVPVDNKSTVRLIRKLGFMHAETRDGIAHLKISSQSRIRVR